MIPCGTKFLREYNFADWHFLFCERYFLRIGQISFSCWELISAIFRKYPVPRIDNIFVAYGVLAIEIQIFKQ